MESDEQCRNLGIRAFSRENFRHHLARLFSREGLAVIGNRVQSVNNHAVDLKTSIAAEAAGP
jgi:hypothetical protein